MYILSIIKIILKCGLINYNLFIECMNSIRFIFIVTFILRFKMFGPKNEFSEGLEALDALERSGIDSCHDDLQEWQVPKTNHTRVPELPILSRALKSVSRDGFLELEF